MFKRRPLLHYYRLIKYLVIVNATHSIWLIMYIYTNNLKYLTYAVKTSSHVLYNIIILWLYLDYTNSKLFSNCLFLFKIKTVVNVSI